MESRKYPSEKPESIEQIRLFYDIGQSTAYKWRKALQERGLEVSWQNLDLIDCREISPSSSEIVSVDSQEKIEISVENSQISIEEPQSIPFGALGISRERLLELNAEVQAETRIKSVLRSHYEQEEAARAADRATKLKEGVMSASPESIISWVQGVARTA